MPMIGANGGLIGSARTSRRGAAVGLWTPNEQVIYQRQNAWIGDASFDSVSLLLHMDGSNGSTTFTDSSKNAGTVTANGNAQISTAQSRFGGASAYFDGTGDYLTFANSASFAFGTGDFTIEFWFRSTAAVNDKFLLGGRSAIGTMHITTGGSGSTAGALRYVGSSTITSGNTVIDDQAWHHCAIVRQSSNVILFVDGVSRGSGTDSTNYSSATGTWVIGANDFTYPTVSSGFLTGYIDDLRITKGVARYSANFTPPSAAFPDL